MNAFLAQLRRSARQMLALSPMILGVIALVGIVRVLLTPAAIGRLFDGNWLHDTLVGTLAGMVAVGQAIVSYLLGGELLDAGVSLYAVSAFVLAWVSLGVVQLPLEVEVLGGRFTLLRNALAFVFTILIAVATVWSVRWVG
ncbi:permease [Nitratifractor sp.]